MLTAFLLLARYFNSFPANFLANYFNCLSFIINPFVLVIYLNHLSISYSTIYLLF